MTTVVQFPGNVGSVTTLAALRSLPSTALTLTGTIIAQGGSAYGDGGGGVFAWDPASPLPDNGLSTIKPNDRTDLQVGRWKLTSVAPGTGPLATVAQSRAYTEIAVAGQTVFPNPALYTDFSQVPLSSVSDSVPGFAYSSGVACFVNGVKVRRTVDYTAPGGVQPITFTTARNGGEVVEFITAALDGSSGQNLAELLKVAVGFNPKAAPFNAVGDGVTDDTAAVQAAFDAAATAKGKITCGPTDLFLIGGITVKPGLVGWDMFRYAYKTGGVANGIRFPAQPGCYVDGRDAQSTYPKNMRFENTYVDARQQPGQAMVFQNAANIEIDGIVVRNHGSKFGTTDLTLLRNPNGIVIDNSFYLNNTAIAGPRDGKGLFRLLNYDFDCMPTGTFSASNYGAGIGVNCGSEGKAFPYTGPAWDNTVTVETTPGTYQQRIVTNGVTTWETRTYARAEWFYKLFGLGIPHEVYVPNVEIGPGKITGAYYGVVMSGVDGFVIHDSVLTNNIRSTDISNANKNGKILDCEMIRYSSCGVLLSYENRTMEVARCRFRSNRVAGAAAIYALHGLYDADIHDNDILGERNSDPGNPDGITGTAIAKCLIAIGSDIKNLRLVGNKLRGVVGIAHIGLSSAFGEAPSYPSHFGVFGGNNHELMAHFDSTGTVQGNIFDGQLDNAKPAISLVQITDALGAWGLSVNVIGNRLESNRFGSWLYAIGMTTAKMLIPLYTGNPWIPGTTSANINLISTTVTDRSGNAGDEGINTIPRRSFDALKATFLGGAGISQAFADDITGGPTNVYRRDGVLYRLKDDAAATILLAYTAAASVQADHPAGTNLLKRAVGATGNWPTGERGTTTYTLSQKPGARVFNAAADNYGFGFTGRSTSDGSLAQSQASLVKIDKTGEIISVVGGAVDLFATSGIFVGEGETWWGWLNTDGKSFEVRTGSGKSANVIITTSGGAAPFTDNSNAATVTVYPTFSVNIGQINTVFSGSFA